MEYDIIFIVGEIYFDHPLCGTAILKRLLEKNGFSVGIIEMPQKEEEITRLGRPKLFFGVSSGSIDSMVRNYTPLKKRRDEDENLDYNESVPDRAVLVYCNWIRHLFKDSIIVLGGVEASLRRFAHYDYWDNDLRKPILFDSRANLLIYGSAEKQIVKAAQRLRDKKELRGISGTCIIVKDSSEIPDDSVEIPNFQEISSSKESFCKMQNLFANNKNLYQMIDNRYVLQYKSPTYTTKDLDEYYELGFSRDIPTKHLRGFQFSVVIQRGCLGGCNFCSIGTLSDCVISRSEDSIVREIEKMTRHKHFRGNVDDLTAPTANMYGFDFIKDNKPNEKPGDRFLHLLRRVREIKWVSHVYIRSGIRYDMVSPELLKEIVQYHIYDTLRIAPEHVNKEILRLMNKDHGNLESFVNEFNKLSPKKKLSFYFIVAHPGSSLKEARELAEAMKKYPNTESFQVFTPTPMTASTCMYHTGINPKTGKRVYVPHTYNEKKMQKRMVLRYIGGDEVD